MKHSITFSPQLVNWNSRVIRQKLTPSSSRRLLEGVKEAISCAAPTSPSAGSHFCSMRCFQRKLLQGGNLALANCRSMLFVFDWLVCNYIDQLFRSTPSSSPYLTKTRLKRRLLMEYYEIDAISVWEWPQLRIQFTFACEYPYYVSCFTCAPPSEAWRWQPVKSNIFRALFALPLQTFMALR